MEGFLSEPRDICVNPNEKTELGLLCAPRDICVNPKEKSSGCCVRPGISV